MKEPLRVEPAAVMILEDQIKNFFQVFGANIRLNRNASRGAVSAMIDGLAGAMALTIAGRHDTRDQIFEATVRTLRERLDRDLQHLGRS